MRRGGFRTSAAVPAARDRVLAASPVGSAGQGWTVAWWLRHGLSTLPLEVRPFAQAA
jgi:hypothetical protein